MADALCREYPSEWWFPESHMKADETKAICRRCLVLEECFHYAMRDPDAYYAGIWAGTSPSQRQQIGRPPISPQRVRAILDHV